MESEIEVFREFIRNKGLRKTPEREQVVMAVFASHDHFDVDELYVLLRRQNEKISKAIQSLYMIFWAIHDAKEV